MTRLSILSTLVAGLTILAAPILSVARGSENATFEQTARPVFKAYCFDCHGAGEKLKGNLDLRLRRGAVKGGRSGPALIPGNPAKSYVLERMKAGEMPPGEKKVPADK